MTLYILLTAYLLDMGVEGERARERFSRSDRWPRPQEYDMSQECILGQHFPRFIEQQQQQQQQISAVLSWAELGWVSAADAVAPYLFNLFECEVVLTGNSREVR